MHVKVGLLRKLSAKESMLLNCGVEGDSWESLGWQEIQLVHPKGNQSWIFIGRTDAEAETPIFGHLMWGTDTLEKMMLRKIEGGRRRKWQRMRRLDGITDLMDMSWVSSVSLWWTGKPGVLQSIGLQRVGHTWVTELMCSVLKIPWWAKY